MSFVNKSRFIVTKYDIKAYPFQEYSSLGSGDLESLAEFQGLTTYNTWMLPQLQSLFGTFTLSKDDKGMYLPLAVLAENIGKDPYLVGIWRVVNKLKRSSLVKSQITPQFTEFSALVPLILAGIKKYQGIPYSAWSTEGLEHIVDANLHAAMVCGSHPDYPSLGSDRLIELRKEGLTTKSGPKFGQVKKPTSSWCLTGVQHTEIGELPKLAQTMLTQIWVAHPQLRSPYMVLDPNDWDSMPDALISHEVLLDPKPDRYATALNTKPSTPWDA